MVTDKVRFYGANRFQSYLLYDVDSTQTSISIKSTVGMPLRPFKLTVGSEIMDVIDATASELLVIRGTENTIAEPHFMGDVVENRWTAGTFHSIWYNFDNLIVDTAMIENAAITSAKIKFGEIDTAHIKMGAITTALIDIGAVGTAQISDGSITDAKIVGLTANKITAGKIDAAEIEVVNLKAANITVGQINGYQIAAGAIGESNLSAEVTGVLSQARDDIDAAMGDIEDLLEDIQQLEDDVGYVQTTADGKNKVFYTAEEPAEDGLSVNDVWFDTEHGNRMSRYDGNEWLLAEFGEDAVADLSITDAKISNATISDAKIIALDAAKITTGLLDAARIRAGSIDTERLASGSVTAEKITAGAITSEKILTGAIEAGHLSAGAVTADALSAGIISADHLAANSVTSNKIVAEAVTSDKIAADTILADHIAANTIETEHISYEGLHADVITAGTIDAARIRVGTDSSFDSGYDPSTKETPAGAQQKADDAASAAEQAAKDYAEGRIPYKVDIFSTGGLVFKNGVISTTLIARVYRGKDDITDLIDANHFRWTRVSDDPAGDAVWNDANYGGTKQIVVTQDDVFARATFVCEILEFENLEDAS